MKIITNADLLTDTTMSIHNHPPEKTIKSNTSIPLSIQVLIKQKRKIKKTFIKSRNPFLKSALNVTSKKIKKQIKSHRNVDVQKIIQNLQLSKDMKNWGTLKKEMGFSSKESSFPDLQSDTSIARTDQDKVKQFAEQMKSVFANIIELKDKNLERKMLHI